MNDMNRFLQKMRVKLGYLYTALTVIFARPANLAALLAGFVLAILGEAIRCWASGHIVKLDRITTTGPYAICRNPLYLGSLILGTGVGIASGRKALLYGYWLFFALVYTPTILAEEEELEKKFQEEFLEYRRRVPALIPEFKNFMKSEKGSFSMEQFIKNREYRGIFALLATMLLFFWKYRRAAGNRRSVI